MRICLESWTVGWRTWSHRTGSLRTWTPSSLSTYSGTASTYSGTASTYSGTASTYLGTASTYSGTASTYSCTTSTYSGTASTYLGTASTYSGTASTYSGTASTYWGTAGCDFKCLFINKTYFESTCWGHGQIFVCLHLILFLNQLYWFDFILFINYWILDGLITLPIELFTD